MERLMVHVFDDGSGGGVTLYQEITDTIAGCSVTVLSSEFDCVNDHSLIGVVLQGEQTELHGIESELNARLKLTGLSYVVQHVNLEATETSHCLCADIVGINDNHALSEVLAFFIQHKCTIIQSNLSTFTEKHSQAEMMKLYLLIQTEHEVSIDTFNHYFDDCLNPFNLIGHIRPVTQ